MRQVSIRSLSGEVIQKAAEEGERLTVTNNHLVCGLLLPIDDRQLSRLVQRNLSRMLHAIQLTENELADGDPVVTLDQALDDEPAASTGSFTSIPAMRNVRLGDISGQLIEEAAAAGEKLGITNNHTVCALLVPVTRQWVNQVAERNLSRLVRSAQTAEQDLAGGELVTLDEALGDEVATAG